MTPDLGGEYKAAPPNFRAGFQSLLADNRVAAHLHLAEGYVARAHGIKPIELYSLTRGPIHVARGRQLVMYLAHIQLFMSLAEVGRHYFRDRSTASYACKVIESKRDDPDFDDFVTELEELITLR